MASLGLGTGLLSELALLKGCRLQMSAGEGTFSEDRTPSLN